MKAEKLGRAYFLWRKKKSLSNFKNMLKCGFTGGFLIWKIWRVIRNTVTGKYERLYKEFWEEYDTD